ncbi:hypothetical protein L596_017066 [Steinernema carpocapsae]|uniref:Sepiapterin reductase n=1 Tax=Steinernema carpocapsae TaxID=34508 RepID=A0A4U5N0F2_STECR|nr:hypothetical protein L596_017066 [Steinernema carpocapsae]
MALVGKKTFCVVTGASRGIGQAIATKLAETSAPESTFLLLATNKEKLQETADIVQENNITVNVETVAVDFSDENLSLEGVETAFKRLVEQSSDIDRFIIVHNAGTTGDMNQKAIELENPEAWQSHLRINVTAMVQLNCLLYRLTNGKGKEAPIFVNITSLLAIKAFPSFTQYSTSKAAREAYFRAFAAEEPNVRILSYSPGPVLTDMRSSVIETTFDAGVKAAFLEQESGDVHKQVLTPEQTVAKMLAFLDHDAYESGSRIDYFDI